MRLENVQGEPWHEMTLYELGQCEAIVRAISEMPIRPEDHQSLPHGALVKGARATTAIEGNTLTEE